MRVLAAFCHRPSITALCCSLFLAASAAMPLEAQQTPQDNPDRKQALDLARQGRMEDALPILEKLAVETPSDAVVQEGLGSALAAHSTTLPDPDARRAVRLRARQAFLRAQSLGDRSNYVSVMLEKIPTDGSDFRFSDRKQVDDAMRVAEAAFGRGDFDEAITDYAQVIELDPQNYEAALFTGDVYYKKNDYDNAGLWFSKAIAIDPNRETAYRYWGDALSAGGMASAARERFIEAVVASPYQKTSWVGLTQWADRNKTPLTPVRIQSPNSVDTKPDGKINITIDSGSLGKKDGKNYWLIYSMNRALWRGDKFHQIFPNESQYRHSLAEEVESLDIVANSIAEDLRSKKIKLKNLDPQLALLAKLKQENLLEAYVLLGAADASIARDYPGYYKDHRDKLIQYLNEYVVPPAKN
jgi:tetratricopeptide (TPR) repeat protein